MKISLVPLCASLLLAGFSMSAQTDQPAVPQRPRPNLGVAARPNEDLYRFDLAFSGGKPAELVKAIQSRPIKPQEPKGGGAGGGENGSGGFGGGGLMPLNAIIPDEYANCMLPPLHVKNVNVPELFEALSKASQIEVEYRGPQAFNGNNTQLEVEFYAFTAVGPLKNDSIWYFRDSRSRRRLKEVKQEPACRFFQLRGYLDDYKIEDITTAIQTGWKMIGAGNEPTLSFHKETTLLIAVGDPRKVEMINEVLRQLDTGIQAARRGEKHPVEGAKPNAPSSALGPKG